MKAFEALTAIGQAARLRKLGLQALQQYDIRIERISLISHMNNATFRIQGRDRAERKSQQYVLRVNRPGFQDHAAIQSELAWMRALRDQEGLVVPDPVQAADGTHVVKASHDGVPQTRDCVLFRWISGRFFGSRFAVRSFRRAGQLLARIHQHGLSWHRPSGFARKTLDYDLVMGGQPGVDSTRIRCILSPHDTATLDRAAETMQETMTQIGRERDAFGLIHGDYHVRHLLFTQGNLAVIDFDECGWGFFAYDIAVALSEVMDRENYPLLRLAFLEGYRTVRDFPEEHEHYLRPLVAARLLLLAISMAGIVDHPGFRRYAPEISKQLLSEVRKVLDDHHTVMPGHSTRHQKSSMFT